MGESIIIVSSPAKLSCSSATIETFVLLADLTLCAESQSFENRLTHSQCGAFLKEHDLRRK